MYFRPGTGLMPIILTTLREILRHLQFEDSPGKKLSTATKSWSWRHLPVIPAMFEA
jgi:hypothetical protein